MSRTVADNRKARHDFHILETYEAGIVLKGVEVKSIRAGRVNLKDGYAQIENGELFLHNVHISPYEQGNIHNQDPLRKRKLLMHKKEIMKLLGKIREKGLTLVPLKLYFSRDNLKVKLGLAQGKKLHDKREASKARDAKRDIAKAMKNNY